MAYSRPNPEINRKIIILFHVRNPISAVRLILANSSYVVFHMKSFVNLFQSIHTYVQTFQRENEKSIHII